MALAATEMRCAGCDAVVRADLAPPFRCPEASASDDIDHVLTVPSVDAEHWDIDEEFENPFLRYRRRMLSYRISQAHGMTDETYINLVCGIDEAVGELEGQGFRKTPLSSVRGLVRTVGSGDPIDLWVKNDSGNVSGSHKARHLMGVMIYLKTMEALGLPIAESWHGKPLAIASCGNAALGAAVVARAARWPLDVFIPVDASEATVERLHALEARVHICPRKASVSGDPCYYAFRSAVSDGSLPFSVQGNENGLVVEGGKTIIYEMLEQLDRENVALSSFFVQVGGGALGSACVQALREAEQVGALAQMPTIYAVQTEGLHPLQRAHRAFVAPWNGREPSAEEIDERRAYAVRHRAQFMKPWPHEPRSVASGILDDETYDWACLVDGMVSTGGFTVLANEGTLRSSNQVARGGTEIGVCHTGSAGLAGVLALNEAGVSSLHGHVGVLFTGSARES